MPDRAFPLGLRRNELGSLEPVLTGAEGLLLTRAPSPSLVGRNLAAFECELRKYGATLTDLRWLLEGYTAADQPSPALNPETEAISAERQSLPVDSAPVPVRAGP